MHVVVPALREKRFGEFEEGERLGFDALHVHGNLVRR